MATLLDFGLLQQFSGLFPILLVFFIAYGFFIKFKLFEGSRVTAIIVCVLLALVMGLTPVANRAIQLMAPYYVLLIILLFFMILSMMMLGVSDKDVSSYVLDPKKKGAWVGWTVGTLALVIGLVGFGKAMAEAGYIPGLGGIPPEGVSEQESIFFSIIFHPKVMGMILVLAIVIFTINRLAAEAELDK